MAMSASAADIRSALSLPDATGPTPGPSQPKSSTKASQRKPEGISRELYSLIGPSAPSLAAQFAKPRLKQKPNLGGGSKVKWELRTFSNPARADGLMLRHWEKVTADGMEESRFAKYNVQPPLYTCTPEEYTRYLEDKEWTREETDYLLKTVHEFDVRWYVIHDRYDFPGGPPRSLDDLKDRYYSVCRKLIRNRPWAGDEAARNQLISSYQFDKEREATRKKYIASLESRTPEQLAEEEALYVEIKRLEQNERKFKRDRENLLRTIAGIESGLPDIPDDDGIQLGIITDGLKKKKKGGLLELESPATPSTATTAIPPIKQRPQPKASTAFDAQHCITRTELPNTSVATKAAHQPAFLRSYKLPIPKPAILPKITQALAELGISHSRLVMPTRENVSQLESLVEATTQLAETKRQFDKIKYDIQVLKERSGIRQQGEGEVKMEEGVEDGLDGDGEGEDGRGQSLSRGRKHSRRSMSISSVDTSTAGRPNTKRQKRG